MSMKPPPIAYVLLVVIIIFFGIVGGYAVYQVTH